MGIPLANLPKHLRGKPSTKKKPHKREPRRGIVDPSVTSLDIVLPLRTKGGLNAWEKWYTRSRRQNEERDLVCLHMQKLPLPPLPATITFTRMGPGKMDDDNIPGSLKTVRDQVAELYAVDDGSDKYVWRYQQEKSKVFGVRVQIVAKRLAVV